MHHPSPHNGPTLRYVGQTIAPFYSCIRNWSRSASRFVTTIVHPCDIDLPLKRESYYLKHARIFEVAFREHKYTASGKECKAGFCCLTHITCSRHAKTCATLSTQVGVKSWPTFFLGNHNLQWDDCTWFTMRDSILLSRLLAKQKQLWLSCQTHVTLLP